MTEDQRKQVLEGLADYRDAVTDEERGKHAVNLKKWVTAWDTAPDPESAWNAAVERAASLPDGEAVVCLEKAACPQPLPPETWKQVEPPPRQWLIPGLIPAGRLCSLYGVGGSGKSLLSLQLAAGLMDGSPPLAVDPGIGSANRDKLRGDWPVMRPGGNPRRVLMLTWEDERDEVLRRWRMAHHAGAIKQAYPDPDRLALVDMRKIGGPLWGPQEGLHVSTAATWTPTGKRFLASLEGYGLAIIDPIAAAYASSEIDRPLVRAFCSALDGEAERAGCAVLLIGHQPKTDSDYSGSTDWQAAVRGQLVLEVSKETAHTIPNPDNPQKPNAAKAYRLRNAKQSYAAAGDHLWLRREWQPPGDGKPARLAWFATTARKAAEAYEGRDVDPLEKKGNREYSNEELGL